MKIIAEDRFGWPIEVVAEAEGEQVLAEEQDDSDGWDKAIEYRGYKIGVIAGIPSDKPFEYGTRKQVYLYDPSGKKIGFYRTIALAKLHVDRLLRDPEETFIMSKDGSSYRHSGTEKEIKDLERRGWVITDRKPLLKESGEVSEERLEEAEYQGRKVNLNKPFRTPDGPKKFSVYTKNDQGNVVKVNFGDPNMEIKRDDPQRRKSFRARHNCESPGPKWKPRYWSCQATWHPSKKVSDVVEGVSLAEESGENKLVWKRDKSVELTKMGETYPLVAKVEGGEYRIIKVALSRRPFFKASFVPENQKVGTKIVESSFLETAKIACQRAENAKRKGEAK